ncbi:MAG: 2-oxoacid:acceptor oxidoreductase subunit alpha [Acidobacteria bacterium]|nr:MAG: 2-oxoacid:acceptor oxidoreductase subunit alpha [Acidobacteriota bacterium]
MTPSDIQVEEAQSVPETKKVVNDFSIRVATVNGTGSQTSNLVLLRALFQMGIPVTGKNIFPSNIAGLPTWFIIRASKDGYLSHTRDNQVLVALNPETAEEDVHTMPAGSAIIYDEPLKLDRLRDDVVFYAVPFNKLVAPICRDPKLRKYVRNMIYVGVLAHLLAIDKDEIARALNKQLGRKKKALEMNWAAIEVGWQYAQQNLTKRDPFLLEPMDRNWDKILIDGNTAAALGCIFAGVTVVSWYPITPSSSLGETIIDYMKKYRIDKETGKATFAVVQAEDELAALGMVLGAGWAGARAMTATSGPGISLMAEFSGLGYYAEVPAVIFDVQRVGPSTGLPTRTMQGDLLSTAVLSHGDTKHIMLFPGSAWECYTMALEAFDLAEEFQTPVFVMSDLDLGMNYWISDPLPYPDRPPNRGKVLTEDDLRRLGRFERYRDVDGDGIPYRTIPGTPLPAYFCRGSGHNEQAEYTERPDAYVRNMDRLARKFETARQRVPAPEIIDSSGARVGIIGYGSSHYAILEARDQLRARANLETAYLRIRAYPFNEQVEAFVRRYAPVYVVDLNRDGQMRALLKLDLPAELASRLRSVRHYDGHPIDARHITDDILSQEASL